MKKYKRKFAKNNKVFCKTCGRRLVVTVSGLIPEFNTRTGRLINLSFAVNSRCPRGIHTWEQSHRSFSMKYWKNMLNFFGRKDLLGKIDV